MKLNTVDAKFWRLELPAKNKPCQMPAWLLVRLLCSNFHAIRRFPQLSYNKETYFWVVLISGFISIGLVVSEMYAVALLVLLSMKYIIKNINKYRDYL